MTDPGFAREKVQACAIELIPGEHYIVFTDSSDAPPDEDTVEELRIIAYARRNKGTLGPAGMQAVETLAETVATGVFTNAIWAECQAAKEYVDKLRRRRRERIQKAGEAAERALEAVQNPQVPVTAPSGANVTVSGTGEEGTTWQVSCRTGDKPVQFQMDVSGAVIEIMIRPRPQE